MTKEKIDLQLARRLVLNAQLLDGKRKQKGKEGKEGIARTIEHLGYVQIDTISVINRAHHHVIWTRCPGYREEMLDELQAKDRRVFEYWAHAAAYLPLQDYRFYLPKMKKFRDHPPWVGELLKQHKHLYKPIMERFKNEGALGAKDFKAPKNNGQNGWWEWKPAKWVLEHLFWGGELMISHRNGFQKVYDLPERVLPDGIDLRFPEKDETARFFARRSLRAYGLAMEKEISGHLKGSERDDIASALKDLEDSGEVAAVAVEGLEKETYYALRDVLEGAEKLKRHSPKVFLLSPFDNLVIQRERVRRLFDFDYTIECYVPAPKRVYGYFSLPVLWNGRLVARLDPKADRKKKIFYVRNLVFEPRFKAFDRILPKLADSIRVLAAFNGCEEVIVEKTSPGTFAEPLTAEF